MKIKHAAFCALLLAGSHAMACYTVYDRNERVTYHGSEPPVDMSLPLHDTLGRTQPGAQMVFDQEPCTRVPLARVARSASPDLPVNTMRIEGGTATASASTGTAPLLIDRASAQRRGLPYVTVAGAIVAVAPAAAARDTSRTVTLTPTTVVASAPDTRMMGNAGAGFDTRVMGGPPAQRQVTEEVLVIQRGRQTWVAR
jgi:hypothetical protein